MTFTLPDNDEAFNTNQSIWMQTDINALIAAINGDGVVSGCVVSEDGGGASMDLDITSGTIQINDTAYSITGSAAAVTIGAADGSNPRIDLVSAKSDDTLNVTAGAAAANPKAPDIPASSVLLAMVYVPASDTTIADNQITDKRVIVRQVTATTQKSVQTHTVLHSETLASAGSFDVTSIDQTYDHLLIRMQLRGDVAATTDNAIIYFNNDTTATNYYRHVLYQANGAHGTLETNSNFIGSLPASTSTASFFGRFDAKIYDYAGSNKKMFSSRNSAIHTVTGPDTGDSIYTCEWNNTAAINRITIVTDNDPTDEFDTGSFLEIIGVKEETVLIV